MAIDDVQLFLDNLNNPASSAIYSEAPAAGFEAAQSFSDRAATLSDERLNAVTCGESSGNSGNGLRSWGQGFFSAAHQGAINNLQGYDTHTAGGAIGTDTSNWIPNAVVGASLSYAHTDADARDTTQADTSIQSYQLTVYGDYDLGDHMYLRGLLGYARSNDDETRQTLGTVNRGSYDANEYTMLVKVGKSYKHEAMTVTPSMLGRWVHYDPSSYTETGPNALSVQQNPVDVVEVGPSVDATWKVPAGDGSWIVPSVHAGFRYDLAGERVSTTYSGPCCGTTFALSPDVSQLRTNLGASLTFYTTGSMEFKTAYDMDYRKAYLGHTGVLRGTIRY